MEIYKRLNEILGNRPAICPPVILDTLTDNSTVASDEMSDEDEDGPVSGMSDDVDGPELTSNRSATPVSRSPTPVSRSPTPVSRATTIVSIAGIRTEKDQRAK